MADTRDAKDDPRITDDMLFGATVGWHLAHEESCQLGWLCSMHQPINAEAQRPRLVQALLMQLSAERGE